MKMALLALSTIANLELGRGFNSARLSRVQRRGIITLRRQQRLHSWSSSGPYSIDWSQVMDGDAATLAEKNTQQLFRHKFIIEKDFVIRLPLDASAMLRSCTVHSHLSTCIQLQLEAFRPLRRVKWSPDATRMLSLPNAGGSSLISEALALELLARAFGVGLEKTELELAYRVRTPLTTAPIPAQLTRTPSLLLVQWLQSGSQMTDFAIDAFGGYPLGVSVTRAYKWHGVRRSRLPSGLDPSEARRLLIKKLTGSERYRSLHRSQSPRRSLSRERFLTRS